MSFTEVLERVAQWFDVRLDHIMVGKNCKKEHARARCIAAFLIHRIDPELTLAQVGEAMGGRTAKEIADCYKKARALMESEPAIAAMVAEIETAAKSKDTIAA